MTTEKRNATILLGIVAGIALALSLYALNLLIPVAKAITMNLQAAPEVTVLVILGVGATYIVKNL